MPGLVIHIQQRRIRLLLKTIVKLPAGNVAYGIKMRPAKSGTLYKYYRKDHYLPTGL